MLTAAWVCLVLRYSTGNLRWDERSRLFELVGVLVLPLTIAAAFVDTRGIGFLLHPRTDAPLIWHMTSGLVAAGAFSWHYLWRRGRVAATLTRAQTMGEVGLATLGMLALVAAGLLSAEMVYAT
jgi:hypothetical protein